MAHSFPLKGRDGSLPRFFGVLESMLIRAASGVFTLKLVPLHPNPLTAFGQGCFNAVCSCTERT